jgi:hypothetical protein
VDNLWNIGRRNTERGNISLRRARGKQLLMKARKDEFKVTLENKTKFF